MLSFHTGYLLFAMRLSLESFLIDDADHGPGERLFLRTMVVFFFLLYFGFLDVISFQYLPSNTENSTFRIAPKQVGT